MPWHPPVFSLDRGIADTAFSEDLGPRVGTSGNYGLSQVAQCRTVQRIASWDYTRLTEFFKGEAASEGSLK